MPYSLGAGQCSKSASLYQIKYMAKESFEIAASALVLVEAYKESKKYSSIAIDAGTMERDGKYFCQHLINLVTMEMDAVQAASLVTSLRSSASSDSIQYFSGWDVQRLARIVENKPPYSLVLNTPLVSKTSLQTSATRNLQRSSCVTIPAR
jgi:hypothetical protein